VTQREIDAGDWRLKTTAALRARLGRRREEAPWDKGWLE
jgi:hypothetical protein